MGPSFGTIILIQMVIAAYKVAVDVACVLLVIHALKSLRMMAEKK